jgi:hypothetical protein
VKARIAKAAIRVFLFSARDTARGLGSVLMLVIGKKYGKLTVWEQVFPNIYECRCACGNNVTLWRSLVANNVWRHCGECLKPPNGFYGHCRHLQTRDGRFLVRRSAEFNSWDSANQRGIRVCARWRYIEGFKNFLHDMGPRPEGLSLDRIDVQGHYEPLNCKWSDRSEQGKNQRRWLFRDKEEPPVVDYNMIEERIEDEFGIGPY